MNLIRPDGSELLLRRVETLRRRPNQAAKDRRFPIHGAMVGAGELRDLDLQDAGTEQGRV
jgi:hypothetical protein